MVLITLLLFSILVLFILSGLIFRVISNIPFEISLESGNNEIILSDAFSLDAQGSKEILVSPSK